MHRCHGNRAASRGIGLESGPVPTVLSWINTGVDDPRHLKERATNHERSASFSGFYNLGNADIRKQLDTAYINNIRAHNARVDKNRHILRRLIMCIQFCGVFELALRGHDESKESQNPGIFQGLIDFTTELDSVLSDRLK